MDQSFSNTSSETHAPQPKAMRLDGLISDDTAAIIEHVVDIWINNIISYIGLIGNVVQIVVFSRLGFQETINISMTFLASWDLVRCFANVVTRFHGFIKLFSPPTAVSWFNLSNIFLVYLSGIAGYVSAVLAGYVAIERCLCVSLPFTVRFLLTRKVVIVNNVLISIIVFASMVINYPCYSVYTVVDVRYNTSVYVWGFNSFWYDNPEVDQYLSAMYILWIVLSFLVICTSTSVIACHLRRASKFRDLTTSRAKADSNSSRHLSPREQQVMKMLLMIIAVYIICSLPRILFFVVRAVVPEFDHYNLYHNSLWVSVNIMNIFDFVNAGINPFIFYFMSSSFRSMFLKTFSCSKSKG